MNRVRRRVCVLGRLSLAPEDPLAASARRAIAYLAVKGPVAQRSLMGVDLWPAVEDTRARANLRRAIWQTPGGWVSASSWEVRLEAEVDLAEAHRVADRALEGAPLDASEIDLLTRDLLPGWYDEWLLDAQDAHHLVRVQALESACGTATRLRQYGLATRAGLAAVAAEPLRQSAVCALIKAHLEEGNTYEALRRYEHHRSLVRHELGVEPAAEMTELIGDVTRAVVGAGSAPAGRWPPTGGRPRGVPS